MPASRLSMRKIKEVMRLRFELKLGYQRIGRSCAIAVSIVHKYLKRAEDAGLSWPLPEGWDEARVEATLLSSGINPCAALTRQRSRIQALPSPATKSDTQEKRLAAETASPTSAGLSYYRLKVSWRPRPK